jgi:hypothetical protein
MAAKATVGRQVHFWPAKEDTAITRNADQPCAATIVAVLPGETTVSLAVFDAAAILHQRLSVPLIEKPGAGTKGGYATWPAFVQPGTGAGVGAAEHAHG